MKIKIPTWLIVSPLFLAGIVRGKVETLEPLVEGKAPSSYEALWEGYDPRREPLEAEVLKEWEQDGVILRVVRYQIGVFKGQRATMAAVYGFPKGASRVPGLVQIHGGGQAAHANAVLTNAHRGYATISIAWAGRISAPGYDVNADLVKLFWDGPVTDPRYKLTTDWGALDAYHAPCRNPQNNFFRMSAAPWTLDAVESPRNNSWFLCVLASRRALTFLEQQPEVDPAKLGVYGHSMGGKITVLTAAADSRVKAAAPSCGGISDRPADNPLYAATIADSPSLKRLACPIIFLSPANDFHGRIDDLQTALGEISSSDWRVTCSAHASHQDLPAFMVAGPLWFDQHLKNTFRFPQTPAASLELHTANGIPSFKVKPDASRKIVAVEAYYTQHGTVKGGRGDRDNTVNRFWHSAPLTQQGDTWTAELPLLSIEQPLWAYANVRYALDEPVTAAGYYYSTYTAREFNLSSPMRMVSPDQLQAAGIKASARPSRVIETFGPDWQREWFTYSDSADWSRKTHKVYDPQWAASAAAVLALEVRSAQANRLVIGLDGHAAEVRIAGGEDWQRVRLAPGDLQDATGAGLPDWNGLRELRLSPAETLRTKQNSKEVTRTLGGAWQGPPPEFRLLEWSE